jgi:tetratricopeptide (TPR) repeat protein
MDKNKLSSEYYHKSLKIRQAVLPPKHPQIALTYNNLGLLYYDNGEYAEALKFYQESLEMNYNILPPTHPLIAQTENDIRKLKDKMKN